MKKALMFPFNAAIKEIKKDNYLRKTQKYKRSKVQLSPFMAFNFMFLFIITVLYLYTLYIAVLSIFFAPLDFVALPIPILGVGFFTLIYTKVYPKTKRNYLKSMNLYKEYEEITNHFN